MAKVFLHGVGIQFYRGIGEEAQLIGPFSEVNFFIGANNAGKSIVLNFIHDRLPFKEGGQGEAFADGSPEVYQGKTEGKFWRAVGVPRRRDLNLLPSSATNDLGDARAIELEVAKAVELIWKKFGRHDLFWAVRSSHGRELFPLWRGSTAKDPELNSALHLVRSVIDGREIKRWSKYDVVHGEILRILGHLCEKQPSNFPPSKLIAAKRELGPNGDPFDKKTDEDLMKVLASLQNPEYFEREKRSQFDAINAFLQEVTGKPEAVIEVPHD